MSVVLGRICQDIQSFAMFVCGPHIATEDDDNKETDSDENPEVLLLVKLY